MFLRAGWIRRHGGWRSGRESFLSIKTAVIVVTVVLTWAFALAQARRMQASGATHPATSAARAGACSACGRAESVCAPVRPAPRPERQ